MAAFLDKLKEAAKEAVAMPIVSVIKNEVGGDVLLWTHTREDFNTGAQLVVTEFEEALFVKDGIIEQIFGPGRYTLTTQNFPFLTRLMTTFVTGGESPFSCKVIFINKSHHLELKWGTAAPMHILDPVWGVELEVRAFGSYSIAIKDPKKFYIKLVGARDYATDDDIVEAFDTAFIQTFTDELFEYLSSSDQEILVNINRKKPLAEALKPELDRILDEYGITLCNFYIENMAVPDDNNSMARIREMRIQRQENNFAREQTAADTRLGYGLAREEAEKDRYVSGQAAQADYERMTIRDQNGTNGWARQEAAQILQTAAENTSTPGAFTGIGMGIGTAKAVSGMMPTMFAGGQMDPSILSPTQGGAPSGIKVCPNCNSVVPAGMGFCGTCGMQMQAPEQQTCPSCGAVIPAGMKFCGACGKPISLALKCSSCGAEIPAGMKFCGVCGTPAQ